MIDILKEAVLRTGCLAEVSAVAGSGNMPAEVLAERLMLAIYAYGTNTGIRAVAAGGGHDHSEDEIRYVRRRYLTRGTAQRVAINLANAIFAARQHSLWAKNRPRWPRTRPTCAPTIRICSPSGTRATAATGS